ncbi:Protein of unknown function [Lactobacillus helveticus CIRM-BIA 953]|uniref:Uncharacterized protein n=1 Tax=Lactobacillus helveticus CIRM-BIA 953 TaxID=1226335 RepID=U4QJI1_LACHE|nr:Protein of unknown function [Lactobacillus helveticus CIRM-BIA 953]CDI42147.1 Protein of unknown function [Lactobacillus helveticus CIRM-BIA 953]CDI43791.1 Protein of unknown function [Lactobacillus helveticus CIRM-BIA 953]CDI43811.1 Protein of unknown function [Lactobacillus helveticus CIRM-BIA 953]
MSDEIGLIIMLVVF